MFIVPVLASQLHFLANKNAELAIPPLFWPVNCIKIGGLLHCIRYTVVETFGRECSFIRLCSHSQNSERNVTMAVIPSSSPVPVTGYQVLPTVHNYDQSQKKKLNEN